MLSPKFPLTVQLIKGLSAFGILKQLTPRGRLRRSGRSPMGSSFPRHGVKERTKTQSRTKRTKKEKKKKKPSADYKLAQNKYKTKIYMMHEHIK